MADSLTIFGTDYTGVMGIKATGTGNGTLTYIRPQGTKSIAANGTGIDVTEYASVDVSVPAQDSTLVVTVSWNSQTEMWEPDCTYSEIAAAASAGKTLIMTVPTTENATADCFWDDDNSIFVYCVFGRPDSVSVVQIIYVLTEESLEVDYYNEITQPSGTINITQAGNTDVTQYATASVPNAQYDLGEESEYFTQNSQRKWRIRPLYYGWDAGWNAAGTNYGTYSSYNAVPANTTVTPSTSAQTIGGANYMMEGAVTVAAMPTGTAGTPTATKGSVSNHSVSVTPSVTNTTGYITGSTKTGTAVTVSASELVSGSQTITENGTVDVTDLASVTVDVQGGSPSLHIGTATYTPTSAMSVIGFQIATDTPTSFVVIAHDTLSTGASPYKIATAYYALDDEQSEHGGGQVITNTSNAQVSYEYAIGHEMNGDDHTILVVRAAEYAGIEFQPVQYDLIYTYGGGTIDTKQVQVGSGATSITFTGLEDEPACWYVIFQSDFGTSSGYQRVIAVANDGSDTYGLEMDSAAHYSDQHWTSTYSNGSLTISSQGTNAGGYFHQPGNYLLVYAYDSNSSYQSKTVTPTTSTQEVTADQGYDALRKVTVNPIPSQYIVPTGNISISSNTAAGQSLDVAQYATATVNVPTGGGSVQTDTKTVTASNYPVTLDFTGMKGQPKMFTVRLNTSVSSSGSTTYYYIVNITSHGTTTHGDVFRIGSTRQVNSVTSGYSWSYSGTTLTITSSAASRSASPGAFYSGSYELMYVY